MLHQREGYWETRNEPTWSRGWIFDRHNSRRVVHVQGVLGARYDSELCDGAPGIVVTLGHAPGGLNLELAVDEAEELIELLAAAIVDVHVANGRKVHPPLEFVDVSDKPCTWACCKAVR
ncbi:hypothetical protein [Nocardia salmonicida]|uniref:hypothetical protein n=1 Tax=Nocardia salmonicida TaxID=53431 RepID=UPI002E2C810A|nr:hypothetical protein [Nocardia salmonicida]